MKKAKNCLQIEANVPLVDKNWFKTGGAAKFYCSPKTDQAFQEALCYANSHKIPLFILGQGANILISDDGFDGLVIHPNIKRLYHEDYDQNHVLVHAGAGITIEALIAYCLEHNLTGLEEFSGIPGTVGGSVYINIHYFNFYLSQFLFKATILDRTNAQLLDVDNKWFHFGYDQSMLMKKNHFLVSALFKVKKSNKYETAYALGRKKEIIRHRTARYPTKNTCGSFFRNFHPHEVPYTIAGTDKKIVYVAYYLDKIGIKGALRKKDAIVSHRHANMIVNQANATSHDIIQLAREMQQKVKETFSIIPQPECQLIGFKKYPLLR